MTTTKQPTGVRRLRAAERRHMRLAVAGVTAVTLITALIFGLNLGGGGFVLRAQFASSTNLVPGSAVRIAGVDVGKVTTVRRGPGHTSIVEMELEKRALPLHRDATLAIEPRLLLEGNFYVNVDAGSPAAPTLESGALIGRASTTVPVQLDQVLNTFDNPTRTSLTNAIGALASGLGRGRSGASGATGLRRSTRALDNALDSFRGAARQAQGTQSGDLGRAIRHSRDFAAGLAVHPTSLEALVIDYDTVSSVLAAEARPMQSSVRKLDATLRTARPALLTLNRALPSLTRLGDRLSPVLRTAVGPLRDASRLLYQIDGLSSTTELAGLLRDLRPVTAMLPPYERQLGRLLPLVTDASKCLTKRVIPVANTELKDDHLSTGDPVWLDLLHAATGLSSSIGGFDGNGSAARAGVSGGPTTIGNLFPGAGNVIGLTPPITGVRPKWLGLNRVPPFRPDAPCLDQPTPNLNTVAAPAPDWMRKGHR